MLVPTPKYRYLLFYVLIINYVVSSFQAPLFEAAHFFSHLEQSTSTHSDHQYHLYHDHDQSHEHTSLAILDQNNKDQEEHNLPEDFKKKVENKGPLCLLDFSSYEYQLDNFVTTIPLSALLNDQISPPPELT
jgi:hypothetical protein